MEPLVGLKTPDMRLKVVVFPEPFGPIRALMPPDLTLKETASTAISPPKAFRKLFISRIFMELKKT
jgi:hypothetical protein